MLSADDAVALCQLLEQANIRFWVIGGWGVDALLQRQTRPHKDLDILATLGDLPRLQALLDESGFTRKLVWAESRWVEVESGRLPTAFVAADDRGHELDVHIIELAAGGGIIQHFDHPWPFPDGITAQGRIAGAAVTCVSRETQIAMHTGYSLPESHLRDLELLRADG
jgi:lincosamide nucleotidyltransferase A/C/D/E